MTTDDQANANNPDERANTARDALARSICARICDARRTHDELRVVDDVLAGLEHGAETIGPLDLERDERDFGDEGAQECRDLLAYLAMQKVAAQHRRRERIARSLSVPAAASPACGGRAHPSRDESAGVAPAGNGARTFCCLLVPPCGLCPWCRTQAAIDNAGRDAQPAFVGSVDDLERELSEPTPIESGLAELANADFGLATGLLDDRGVDVQLEQIEDVDNDGDDFGGEAG